MTISDPGKNWFSGNERYWLAIVATICGLITTRWYDARFEGIDDRFAGDSASYIEAARSLLQGLGVDMTPWGYDRRLHPVPLEWWPPGYPVLIAIVAKFGFSVERAATLVTQWSSALSAGAIVLLFTPVIGPVYAFLSASVIFISPAVLLWTFVPGSDPSFLLVAIIAIGCFLQAMQEIDSRRRWIMAGLLLGLTVWLRNAGIALVAAEMSIVAISIVYCAIKDRQAAQKLAKSAVFFAVAAAIPILLLVFFNLYYFGTIFPFHAPPSKVGLFTNITNYVAAQFHDISGLRLGMLHGPKELGRTLLGIVAIAAVAFLAIAVWAICLVLIRPNHSRASIHAAGVLSLYVLFGMATVIAARTRYELGDDINERHVLQYSWAIVVLGFILASWAAEEYRRYLTFAVVAVLVGFAILKVQYIEELYKNELIGFAAAQKALDGNEFGTETNDGALAVLYAQNPMVLSASKDIPKDAVIFTNFPDLMRVRLNIPARYTSEKQIAEGAVKLGEFVGAVGDRAPIYVFFLLSTRFFELGGSSRHKFVADHLERSFVPIRQEGMLFIAQAKRNVSD